MSWNTQHKEDLLSQREKGRDHKYSFAPFGTFAQLDSVQEDAARNIRVNHGAKPKSLRQSILQAEEEFVAQIQSNSVKTIFAITNTMVGSVCLVVPQVFLQNGIISCLLVMIFLGLIQYKTCQLLIKHQRPDEIDIEPMIGRILGNYWVIGYRLTSGTLLFIVGTVYFLLINATLFPILEFLFRKIKFENYASQSISPVFDQFSVQYLALLIFIPLAIPLFIKDISKLIKLAEFGIVAIMSYGLFVIYICFSNIYNGTVSQQKDNVVYFSSNLSQPAGLFALAFMIHNGIGPLMGTNKVKENNQRDLKISYTLAGIIYGMTGVFGALGLLGRIIPVNPSTILDFFDPGDITVLVIECLFLVHLVSAFPIFNFISRHQILNVLYPNSSYPNWAFNLFSAVYVLMCLSAQLINFNPGKVISFDGAVCGFFIIYIIPIGLHMTCYYREPVVNNTARYEKDPRVENGMEIINEHSVCVHHENKDRITKQARLIFYGIFVCVGLFNMAIQFQELFGSI